MNKVKLASTIMLARDNNGLEVLLLKRNKALAFAGGLWVFPGGKIEPSELERSENELEAAKLAAARETHEEANLDINPSSLIFFRHWTTPVVEPRRYATWFFFGGVDRISSDVTIDDSEIKKHLWISPGQALNKLQAGELPMMPPTIMSLQLIRKCNSVAEVIDALKNVKPIFVLPVLEMRSGKMHCLYKGDAGYESGNADMEGPRHRLVFDLANGSYQFEYCDCEDYEPVNGGMHLA